MSRLRSNNIEGRLWRFVYEHRFIILILLLGTLLRLIGLGSESLWLDEAETLYGTKTSPSHILHMQATHTLAPEYFFTNGSLPAYYLISYYWTSLFGASTFLLRFPAVIFGVVSIFLVYLFGKRLFSKTTGLVGAFLFSIHHQNIFYSQEARVYSFLVMAVIGSCYFFYDIIERGSFSSVLWYVLFSICMMYSHYYSIFVFLFQGLFVLFTFRTSITRFKQFVACGLSLVVLYIPWIPVVLRELTSGGELSRIHGSVTFSAIVKLLVGLSVGLSPDLQTRNALVGGAFGDVTRLGWALIISVICLVCVFMLLFFYQLTRVVSGIIGRGLKKVGMQSLLFLMLWFGVPVVTTLGLALLLPNTFPFGPVRYVLYTTPALLLLVAQGIVSLSHRFSKSKSRRRSLVPVSFVVLAVSLLSFVPLYSYYVFADKPQVEEVASYIHAHARQGDVAIIHRYAVAISFDHYYYLPEYVDVFYSASLDEMMVFASEQNSFWLIRSMDKYNDPDGTFFDFAQEHFYISDEQEFVGVTLYKFEKMTET